MKYFYCIVIDGYSYYEVTTHRYKNGIDFYYSQLPENFEEVNNEEFEGYDVWDYLDSFGGYPNSEYVAVDENGNILKDLEDVNETFEKIKQSKADYHEF